MSYFNIYTILWICQNPIFQVKKLPKIPEKNSLISCRIFLQEQQAHFQWPNILFFPFFFFFQFFDLIKEVKFCWKTSSPKSPSKILQNSKHPLPTPAPHPPKKKPVKKVASIFHHKLFGMPFPLCNKIFLFSPEKEKKNFLKWT